MAVATFSRFLLATGQILSAFTCEETLAPDQLLTGQDYIDDEHDPAVWYVIFSSGLWHKQARPASSAAYSGNATLANDGADTGTITPIGATAVVTITAKTLAGEEFSLTTFDPWGGDDTLEFTSTIEGDYTVKIVDFPDLDIEFVIPVRA